MASRRRGTPFTGRDPIKESIERARQANSPASWEVESDVPSVARSIRGGVDRDDFGPMEVDPTTQYYEGPSRSSRVAAHQFVPDEDEEDSGPSIFSGLNIQPAQFKNTNAMLIYGKIYVRWLNNGKYWVYGTTNSIPLTEYRSFRHSRSKGTYVRLLERFGHEEVPSSSKPVEVLI